MFGRDALRRLQVENGGALRAQGDSLIAGGQKAVGPVAGSAMREGGFRENDVSGKVLVEGA